MSTENQQPTYILQFCGVTVGNPGPAGAGVILLSEDRTVLCRFREGVGHQTVNVAEFRALILGMKQAIRLGYKKIKAEGDSRLVINQFQGHWTIGDEDIKALREEAVELKASFHSFRALHIPENYNSAAHSQACKAINNLKDGVVKEGNQVEDDSHDEGNQIEDDSHDEGNQIEDDSHDEGNQIEDDSHDEGNQVEDDNHDEGNQVEDDNHDDEDSLG